MGSTDRLFAAIEAGDADLVRSMVTADASLAARETSTACPRSCAPGTASTMRSSTR